VIDDSILRNRTGVYRDRDDAGVQLALALEPFREKDAFVLAIPSGGVPVGLAVSSRLALPFDLLIIRKIPILATRSPALRRSAWKAISF
jgi:putative phosphoribosyl transferase